MAIDKDMHSESELNNSLKELIAGEVAGILTPEQSLNLDKMISEFSLDFDNMSENEKGDFLGKTIADITQSMLGDQADDRLKSIADILRNEPDISAKDVLIGMFAMENPEIDSQVAKEAIIATGHLENNRDFPDQAMLGERKIEREKNIDATASAIAKMCPDGYCAKYLEAKSNMLDLEASLQKVEAQISEKFEWENKDDLLQKKAELVEKIDGCLERIQPVGTELFESYARAVPAEERVERIDVNRMETLFNESVEFKSEGDDSTSDSKHNDYVTLRDNLTDRANLSQTGFLDNYLETRNSVESAKLKFESAQHGFTQAEKQGFKEDYLNKYCSYQDVLTENHYYNDAFESVQLKDEVEQESQGTKESHVDAQTDKAAGDTSNRDSVNNQARNEQAVDKDYYEKAKTDYDAIKTKYNFRNFFVCAQRLSLNIEAYKTGMPGDRGQKVSGGDIAMNVLELFRTNIFSSVMEVVIRDYFDRHFPATNDNPKDVEKEPNVHVIGADRSDVARDASHTIFDNGYIERDDKSKGVDRGTEQNPGFGRYMGADLTRDTRQDDRNIGVTVRNCGKGFQDSFVSNGNLETVRIPPIRMVEVQGNHYLIDPFGKTLYSDVTTDTKDIDLHEKETHPYMRDFDISAGTKNEARIESLAQSKGMSVENYKDLISSKCMSDYVNNGLSFFEKHDAYLDKRVLVDLKEDILYTKDKIAFLDGVQADKSAELDKTIAQSPNDTDRINQLKSEISACKAGAADLETKLSAMEARLDKIQETRNLYMFANGLAQDDKFDTYTKFSAVASGEMNGHGKIDSVEYGVSEERLEHIEDLLEQLHYIFDENRDIDKRDSDESTKNENSSKVDETGAKDLDKSDRSNSNNNQEYNVDIPSDHDTRADQEDNLDTSTEKDNVNRTPHEAEISPARDLDTNNPDSKPDVQNNDAKIDGEQERADKKPDMTTETKSESQTDIAKERLDKAIAGRSEIDSKDWEKNYDKLAQAHGIDKGTLERVEYWVKEYGTDEAMSLGKCTFDEIYAFENFTQDEIEMIEAIKNGEDYFAVPEVDFNDWITAEDRENAAKAEMNPTDTQQFDSGSTNPEGQNDIDTQQDIPMANDNPENIGNVVTQNDGTQEIDRNKIAEEIGLDKDSLYAMETIHDLYGDDSKNMFPDMDWEKYDEYQSRVNEVEQNPDNQIEIQKPQEGEQVSIHDDNAESNKTVQQDHDSSPKKEIEETDPGAIDAGQQQLKQDWQPGEIKEYGDVFVVDGKCMNADQLEEYLKGPMDVEDIKEIIEKYISVEPNSEESFSFREDFLETSQYRFDFSDVLDAFSEKFKEIKEDIQNGEPPSQDTIDMMVDCLNAIHEVAMDHFTENIGDALDHFIDISSSSDISGSIADKFIDEVFGLADPVLSDFSATPMEEVAKLDELADKLEMYQIEWGGAVDIPSFVDMTAQLDSAFQGFADLLVDIGNTYSAIDVPEQNIDTGIDNLKTITDSSDSDAIKLAGDDKLLNPDFMQLENNTPEIETPQSGNNIDQGDAFDNVDNGIDYAADEESLDDLDKAADSLSALGDMLRGIEALSGSVDTATEEELVDLFLT